MQLAAEFKLNYTNRSILQKQVSAPGNKTSGSSHLLRKRSDKSSVGWQGLFLLPLDEFIMKNWLQYLDFEQYGRKIITLEPQLSKEVF